MKNQKYLSLSNQSKNLISKIKTGITSLKDLDIYFLSLEDFKNQFSEHNNLIKKYFTSGEIEYCKNRISSLAGRYAAKNVIRAILHKDIPWKKMEILSSQTGQPNLSFPPGISISITHEDDLIISTAAVPKTNEIISLGIDAAKISRLSDVLINHTAVLSRILTKTEFNEINNDPVKLTSIWAAKEAVSKALGTGIWHGSSLQEIEITNLSGHLTVNLKGKLHQKAILQNLHTWHLTITNNDEFILALVLALN